MLNQILGQTRYRDFRTKLKNYNSKEALKARFNEDRRCLNGSKNQEIKIIEHAGSTQQILNNIDGKPPQDAIQVGTTASIQYKVLGGLGSNVGDEKWNEVYKRRKAMLDYSHNVNSANKQNLITKSIESDESELITKCLSGRRKAIQYAKNIKKPTKVIPTAHEFDEERFVPYDNNSYMLENQKIKRLF